MTGLELALLAGAGKALLKGGLGAASQFGSAQDLKLTPEQEKRLRELERLQARNALGMTQGERELYRSQAMSPVQAAEREVMARFGAAQNIADIGQGTAFRQQQAMADAGQAARGQVSQAVAQRDAEVAQQQAEEQARLQEQQRQAQALERQAALSLVGGIGEAVTGAAEVTAEHKLAEELYDKQIDNLKGAAKATSKGTQNMLGIGRLAGVSASRNKSPQMEAVEKTRATNESLGGDANRFADGMVPKTEFDILSQYLQQQDLDNIINPITRTVEDVLSAKNVSTPRYTSATEITENLPSLNVTQAVPLHYFMFNSSSDEELVKMLESVTEIEKEGGYGIEKSPQGAVQRFKEELSPERQRQFFSWLQEKRNKGLLKDDFWNKVTKLLNEEM